MYLVAVELHSGSLGFFVVCSEGVRFLLLEIVWLSVLVTVAENGPSVEFSGVAHAEGGHLFGVVGKDLLAFFFSEIDEFDNLFRLHVASWSVGAAMNFGVSAFYLALAHFEDISQFSVAIDFPFFFFDLGLDSLAALYVDVERVECRVC